ncbi:hypothetical protein A2803_03165 [Candidatus Woesebacteria bacterium RIFCSPHIGHO2_01_FULL_44_21]|uniref:Rod shape-determining protein MreD n=1 Tax=Candidatus Woesebacteria bacterium RIFCSPHIGHO2_01_FULL_44_21 TaxID=1802503 RepID=A0A1F7YYV0_9BACT|nr:MAG: hypothetical protein A2803_03165 [Candidatus Woesebacteria bacterium RIFCSPHIGHO2_01_FULL_44_21]OGM69164.1 MAG: hypothetical protein A2897_05080 [Candidatus Woesebacteria bacterium RIFCSPLOWO2_01_FULL_44_24b]
MNKQSLPLRGKKIIFAILFLLAFLERVAFDLGPNFEFVTGAMLLAAAYLGTRYSLTLVLVVMVLSDLTLGNTNIFLFTWSGFLIPALVASKVLTKAKNKIISGSFAGIATSLFFYFWTNFGVWALDSWSMYTNDLNGLLKSYEMGLPFLKMNLLSTILLVPAGFVLFETYLFIQKGLKENSYKRIVMLN